MTQPTRRDLLRVAALTPAVIASARVTAARADATPAAGTPTTDAGYRYPDWLAEPDWLQMGAGPRAIKVIALTPEDEFATAHIAGAAQVDWPAFEITETSDQSVATWRAAVEERLTALGVARGDTVVVYDGGTFYVARLWWLLFQLGHADVRILNGGLPAWVESGGAVETGPSTVAPAAEPYVGVPDEAAIATLEEVKAALDDPDVVLVDARSRQEYLDGHIPGAVSLEFTRNAEDDVAKRWKPADELRALYADLGVTPDKLVIPYCTTGVRSAATYFALRQLDYERVSLFSGSYKEWSSHPELPIAIGAAP